MFAPEDLIPLATLRLALGCHAASSIDHLHAEAEELPVEDHLHLLSSQFLARALQPDHISFQHAILEQVRRKIKDTLRSKCIDDVRPFLEADGSMSSANYKHAKVAIHTNVVQRSIRRSHPNRVLGTKTPPVQKCPLNNNTTLVQLSSRSTA